MVIAVSLARPQVGNCTGPDVSAHLDSEGPPALYTRIPSSLESLRLAAPWDASRPFIESYRRRDEVDVLMPVVVSAVS